MRTGKRDLRTGIPVWLENPLSPVRTDPLKTSERTDVVVAGTGVSGALMADALISSGLRVIAVDRRSAMTGSTPASTAMLQFDLDSPLIVLEKKLGRRAAARAWIRSYGAVHALGERIKDLGIQCHYKPRQSVYLPGNLLDISGLKREAAARRRIGLRSEFIDGEELRRLTGIKKPGAILSMGNGEADPVKLTRGLLLRLRARGGKIVSPFEVAGIDESGSSVRVEAKDGRSIVAKYVVMCMGYEVPKLVRPHGFNITSTWAIATRPQPHKLWAGRQLVWEAADPYLYMRATHDGRVIVGGGDEDISGGQKRDALLHKKSAYIAKRAQRIFPDLSFEPEYAWTGSFGESKTSLPAIGLIPGHKKTYAVLGFGGNGITFSMLAAQIVSRAINGVTDPDMTLFKL